MENEKQTPEEHDYSEELTYNRRKACVTALLKWLECEFFGVFIFLSLFAMRIVMKGAGDFLFGLLGLLCYAIVLADFGLKEGSKARIKNTLRGDSVSVNFGLLIGLLSVAPALVSYVFLLLSYSGVTGSAVLGVKIANAGLWGLINAFVPTMDIADMNTALLAVFPAAQILLMLTVFFTFVMGLRNVDIKTKIMYK